MAGHLHAANGRGFLAVQVVHLDGTGIGGIARDEPGHRVGTGQGVQGALLDHLQAVPVLIQGVCGVAADPVHVDLRGFQDLRHKEPVTHGHDDVPGLHHNAVPEGVLLVQQFDHNGLQGFDGRGRAGGDQVVVVGVEQGHTVEDRGVVEQDGIHLLVDRALGGGRVHTGHLGDKAHVVVDKRLPGHGELAAVGCHLALGEKFGLRGVVFQFAALTHAQELAGTAGQVLVILGGLEVGHAALGGPHLEGGGDGLVSLHNGLADRVVQDRGEGRRGVEELAAGHVPQVVLGHTEKGGRGPQALPGHALNGQIAQGQAAHLLRVLAGRTWK